MFATEFDVMISVSSSTFYRPVNDAGSFFGSYFREEVDEYEKCQMQR